MTSCSFKHHYSAFAFDQLLVFKWSPWVEDPFALHCTGKWICCYSCYSATVQQCIELQCIELHCIELQSTEVHLSSWLLLPGLEKLFHPENFLIGINLGRGWSIQSIVIAAMNYEQLAAHLMQ